MMKERLREEERRIDEILEKKLSRRSDKIGCLLGFRLQIGKLYTL